MFAPDDKILAITNPPSSPFTKGGEEGNYPTNPAKQAIACLSACLSAGRRQEDARLPARCAQASRQVRDYERQIDALVYKLYDLTPEEIKIVEAKK